MATPRPRRGSRVLPALVALLLLALLAGGAVLLHRDDTAAGGRRAVGACATAPTGSGPATVSPLPTSPRC